MMTKHTTIEHTKNDMAWIDTAVLAGGRNITQHTEQLRARLQALEHLSIHTPSRFQHTLDELQFLLSQGLSCAYILAQLAQDNGLYEQSIVYDHLLLHDLRAAIKPLQQWFATYPKERAEQLSWLDWFASFPSSHDGALFFSMLSEESIATIDSQWLRQLLHTTDHAVVLFVHYAHQGTLKTLLGCINEYQQLPLSVQAWLEPLMENALHNRVAASTLSRALKFLATQPVELVTSHPDLLTLWWPLVLANKLEEEQLVSLLHLFNASTNLYKLLYMFINSANKKDRTIEQWQNTIVYIQTLTSFSASWCSLVEHYTVEQYGTDYFNKVSLAYINCLKKIAVIVQQEESLATLTIREKKALLTLLNHPQSEQWIPTIVCLRQLTNEYTLLAYTPVLEYAASYPHPQKYLNAVEHGIKAWSTLPKDQQLDFAQLIYQDVRTSGAGIRAFAFLPFFEYLQAQGISDGVALRSYYVVWQQKPWCSATQFREQINYSLALQKKYPLLRHEIRQEILSASGAKKQLLMDVLAPQISKSEELECLWAALQENNALNNGASLNHLVATQKKASQLSKEQFQELLNFDDPAQENLRRDIMRGLAQKELYLEEKKERKWWSSYYKALVTWLGPIGTGQPIILDKQHHRRAIQTLDKIVYAVEDLSAVFRPTDKVKPALISVTLRSQLDMYRTSYHASWWRSYDRRVLADKVLFSLLNGKNISYTALCNSIIEVMDNVLTQDALYAKRNGKGYSRLYDISIQLLASTIQDVIAHDNQQCSEYLTHIKQLLTKHQQLIHRLDLNVPAFQHVHELTKSLEMLISPSPR